MKQPWRWFFLLISFMAFGATIHYSKQSRGTNMIRYERWPHGIRTYFQRRIFALEYRSLTCCSGTGWDHDPKCNSNFFAEDEHFESAEDGLVYVHRSMPLYWTNSKRFAGFEYKNSTLGPATRRTFKIPIWALSLLTLFYPFLLLLKWLRSLYSSYTGRCPQCCYNLTGNTSGVCPECGTQIRTPSASAGPWDSNRVR